MKKLLLMIALTFSLAGFTFAQNQIKGKVSGEVWDENQKPMEFTTMVLLQAGDSSLVKGAVCDEAGKYAFENIPEGHYMLMASMIGYKKTYSKPFSLTATNASVVVPTLQLALEAKNLNEVVVVGQKPFIEQKLDKMIVNVENSIVSSGGTAMEVLEKAPGIMVDKDDKISLKGKQGVIIMIDGKQTYLSASEVSNMLRNMQSNAVESIEIITNPSAKYDAAGNSGIINIKLKKNKNMGMNGNVTAGAGYGRFPKYNGGINLNYRQGKVNAFGNYNYGYNERYNSNTLIRKVNDGNSLTIFDQYNYRPSQFANHSYKAGLDFFIDKKNTIGLMANGFMNDGQVDVQNNTNIYNGNYRLDSTQRLSNDARYMWGSQAFNLNYKRTFDSTDRELTMDLDYSRFNGQTNDNIENKYFNHVGEEIRQPLFLRSNVPSMVDIKSLKADYLHPIGKAAKVETGIKTSFVTTDNNVQFDSLANGDWLVDTKRTNHFTYTENINAAYLNVSREFKTFSVQLGLRAEQTVSKGNSITMNKVVDRNYLEFFPSVFVSQKLSKDHQLGYSYSRRIDRPSYQDLNPFIYFLDTYTYFQGNPFLKPQFTNSFQVSHTFKGSFITTLGYSHTKDVFTQVTEQNNATKVTIATMTNLESLDNYSLGLSAPIPVTKWWSTNNNLNVYYNQYRSTYLGSQLNNAQLAMDINTNHSFTLPNDFSAELSGFYRSPFVDGILRGKSMYVVGLGVQKTFWDKKASLKLNVNDIFDMMRFRGSINYQDMDLKILGKWESRQARLTFNYRFGKNEVKPARRRTAGSESEQNRVKMGDN